jgi:hypothetical protein
VNYYSTTDCCTCQTVANDSKALINAAKFGKSGSKCVCSFCGKDNHTVDNYFKKHGIPPHLRKSSANSATIEGGNVDASNPSTVSTNSSFTPDQIEVLMSLIHNANLTQDSATASCNQVGSSKIPGHSSGIYTGIHHSFKNAYNLGTLILDSGASHHICISLQWFQPYIAITPINIKLPNGNFAIAKYSGIVRFSPNFIVTNVLYVPEFSINLIYVSKVCQSLSYLIQFSDS